MKLRLKSSEDHRKVCDRFSATSGGGHEGHKAKYFQENYFFDGNKKELQSQRVVLRIRFYNMNEKCVITVKGKAILQNGVGKASEVEEQVDPILGRSFVDKPELMMDSDIGLLKDTLSNFHVTGLICLGGFKNVRDVYRWNELNIEVDETKYDWGTVFEVECEASEEKIEGVKGGLEKILKEEGVSYEYSKVTKFQNFVNQTLN